MKECGKWNQFGYCWGWQIDGCVVVHDTNLPTLVYVQRSLKFKKKRVITVLCKKNKHINKTKQFR